VAGYQTTDQNMFTNVARHEFYAASDLSFYKLFSVFSCIMICKGQNATALETEYHVTLNEIMRDAIFQFWGRLNIWNWPLV
jgi:hypothetical protein